MKTKAKLTSKGHYAVMLDSVELPINKFEVIKLNKRNFFKFEHLTGDEALDYWNNKNTSEIIEVDIPDEILMTAEEYSQLLRDREQQRIADLRTRVERCETPDDLADEFGLTRIETASHWSDLYEGRSSYAILVYNQKEYEILEMAIDIHGADGEWGEAKHRGGEHHHTFSSVWGGLKEYQENCKSHFNGNNYFYKSQESEAEFYKERISEAIEQKQEQLNKSFFNDDFDDINVSLMERIENLIKEWRNIEAGYYDCNGNLEISEEDLESDDFTGYSEDVYSYRFGFNFSYKYSFKEVEEEEEETEA
jgi:hypothetical protein